MEVTGGDLTTALVGLLAIVLTWYTFRQSRKQQQIDAFIRIHDLLTAEESQRGRRKLFAASRDESWPERAHADWDEINRTLSLLETLAMYMDKRIVNRKLARESWEQPFRLARGPAEQFMKLRGDDYDVWPYLAKVFRKAEASQSPRPAAAATTQADPREPAAAPEPRGDQPQSRE